MAEYNLSAVLRLRDNGFASGIRAAYKETEKLERGIGDLKKNEQLKLKLGIDGMARLERLQSAIQEARNNSNKPLSVRLRDQATQQINKLRTEINSLTSKAHNIIANVKVNGADKLKGIKNSLNEGLSGAMMAGGSAMMGLGAAGGMTYGVVNAFQSQMNFEKEMSSVKAILSGSYGEQELEKVMVSLTEKAEEMGATTKFTAAESAKALYYMGMAGWKAEQMTAGLPAVLSLAAAGNTDLATTSDIVTDSMTAFGLKAGQTVKNAKGQTVEATQHYADLMAALVTNANTDVVQAGETLKYAAANVGAMFANGSDEDRMRGAEDMFLITGLMANAGIKSSQAGTASRALFARLGSQTRNAAFALKALGVDFTDEKQGGTGEVRRIRDIIGDLRSRFKEGVSPEQLLEFAETLEGTKLHADTRRKLEGFIQRAQANGGKLPGGEMLKMAAMLNGQEGMSGLLSVLLASEDDWNKLAGAIDNADGAAERMAKIQLDNLAGSITILGSAWDAFQRNLVKGDASKGLRDFVDSLTDSLSKANELFKDGIDFSDFVALGADAVNKLKNKFLEFDGIGSYLAGGALFMGLKKILSMGLKVKATISDLTKIRTATDLGNAIRGNTAAGGLQTTATMNVNVNAMNVKAGVVNLSGPIKGGGSGTGAGGRNSTTISTNQQRVNDYYNQRRQIQNQQRVNDYYAQRQQILTSGTTSGRTIPPVTGGTSGVAATGGKLAMLRGAGGAIGGAGVMAAIFGALDVIATRSNSEYTNNKAVDELNLAKKRLAEFQSNGADISQIQSQLAAIREAEENVRNVAETNQINERRTNAGAVGAVAGSVAGAAIGSVVPVVGTMIGGLIGGILGQMGGVELADSISAIKQTKKPKDYGLTSVSALDAEGTEVAVAKMSAASKRRHQQNVEESERPAREAEQAQRNWKRVFYGTKKENDEGLQTAISAAPSRRRAADEQERAAKYAPVDNARLRHADIERTEAQAAETLRKEAYNAEIQANIRKHQAEETRKNFGFTTLGDNYLATSTATNSTLDNIQKYAVGSEEAARQKGMLSFAATGQNFASGQEYVNLNKNTFDLPNWIDTLKSKFSGTESITQDKNFAPAAASFAGFTTVQTPFKNLAQDTAALSSEIKSTKTQFTELKGYTPAETPNVQGLPEITPPKYDYEKVLQKLPQFTPSQLPNVPGLPEITPPNFDYSAATQNLTGYTPAQLPTIPEMPKIELPEFNIYDKISTGLEEMTSAAESKFTSFKETAASTFDEVSMSISTNFDAIRNSVSSFGEELSTSFSTGIETLKTSAVTSFEEMSTSISAGLESAKTYISTFGEEMSTSFSSSFETINSMATTTFSSLSATISGGVESARATITVAFDSAAAEVQGVWGAIPGFFSGIFGGLGGIASAAGSAIAAGINSGIGMIMSAWDALSGWLSSKISSLASMAASAAASIGIGSNYKGTSYWRGGFTEVNEHGGELIVLPSGKEIYPYDTTQNVLQETKIAHNAKGTSFFSGGWSEVNEHGGELMYLPTGTKIIPHATTVRILREQIKEKLNDNRKVFQQQRGQISTAATESINNATEQANSASTIFRNNVLPQLYKDTAGEKFNQIKERMNEGKFATSNEIFSKNVGTSIYNIGTSAQTFSTNGEFRNNTSNTQEYFGNSRTFDNRGAGSYQSFRKSENLSSVSQNFDTLGNLQGVNIPEYNIITADDSIAVKRAKQIAQQKLLGGGVSNEINPVLQQSTRQNSTATASTLNAVQNTASQNYRSQNNSYQTAQSTGVYGIVQDSESARLLKVDHNYTGTSYFDGGLTTVNEHGGEIISLPDGKNILPHHTFQNVFKDSLGNLQGLQVPEYNRITADDSVAVKRAKQDAQYRQLFNQSTVQNLSTKSPAFLKNSNVYNQTANSSFTGGNVNVFKQSTRQNSLSTINKSNINGSAGDSAEFTQKFIAAPKIFKGTDGRWTLRNTQRQDFRRNSLNPLNILTNIFKRSSTNSRNVVRAGNILTSTKNSMRNFPVTITTPTTVSSSGNTEIFNSTRNLPKIDNSRDSTVKTSNGNFFSGLINIFKQSQRILNPQNWGDIWQLQKNYSDNGLSTLNHFGEVNNMVQSEEFGAINPFQLGNLTIPEIKPSNSSSTSNNTTNSNSTTNTNSSNVNLTFGDVNISNGMDFDSFAHKLTSIFKQGTSNSAQL